MEVFLWCCYHIFLIVLSERLRSSDFTPERSELERFGDPRVQAAGPTSRRAAAPPLTPKHGRASCQCHDDGVTVAGTSDDGMGPDPAAYHHLAAGPGTAVTVALACRSAGGPVIPGQGRG